MSGRTFHLRCVAHDASHFARKQIFPSKSLLTFSTSHHELCIHLKTVNAHRHVRFQPPKLQRGAPRHWSISEAQGKQVNGRKLEHRGVRSRGSSSKSSAPAVAWQGCRLGCP